MDDHLPDIDSLWDYGNPRATEHAFRTLLPVARATGHDSYLAELLTQIAHAQRLQRLFDAAHRTLDEAETFLRPDHVRARTRYLLERGRVSKSAGQPDRARDVFLQAWQLATEHGEDAYAVDAAHLLGAVGPLVQQLGWNRRALELAERSADEEARNWRGTLYNNTAWSYHALDRYEEALTLFQRTLAYHQERGNVGEAYHATWCIGRTLRSLGRLDEALGLQRDLLEHGAAPDEEYRSYVYQEIGACLLALDRRDDALPYYIRAFGLF